MKNELCCYLHQDTVMWSSCKKCKKFLCKKCAQKYPSGYCEECEQKRLRGEFKDDDNNEKKKQYVFSNQELKENHNRQQVAQKMVDKRKNIIADLHLAFSCFIIGALLGSSIPLLNSDGFLVTLSTAVGIGYVVAAWAVGAKNILKAMSYDRNITSSDVTFYYVDEIKSSILPFGGLFRDHDIAFRIGSFFLCISLGLFLGIFLIPIRIFQSFPKNKKVDK